MEHVTRAQFEKHCKENQETSAKLEKLMPLANLIPTLNDIVEEKKALSLISKTVLKWIGIVLSIGLFIWQIIRETRR